jgi:hypothetical protein
LSNVATTIPTISARVNTQLPPIISTAASTDGEATPTTAPTSSDDEGNGEDVPSACLPFVQSSPVSSIMDHPTRGKSCYLIRLGTHHLF